MGLFGSLRQKAGRMILRNRLSSVRRLQHGFDIDKVKKVATPANIEILKETGKAVNDSLELRF
jgi:hypothetical protein